jgi:ABC-2 type transport system permease protein
VLFSVHFPHRIGSLLVVLVLGAVAFAAMGLAITALVSSAEGSSAVINAVYLPMAIVSGTFFSTHSYPAFLRWIADVLPLTHFTKLTRDVMVRNHHLWSDGGAIAVVAAWGLVGLAGAVRGFRWQPRAG